MNGHAKEPMTNYPYILFNQSPDQLRRIGARGGKARGLNWRARLQTQVQARPPIVAPIDQLLETAAEAIAALDSQFPWLCAAEKRQAPKRLQP
jgi:hypothetical protein